MMRLNRLVLAVIFILVPSVMGQQPVKSKSEARGFNLSLCSKNGMGAYHATLAADRKTLDFDWVRIKDLVIKNEEADNHLVLRLEAQADGSVIGTGQLPHEPRPQIFSAVLRFYAKRVVALVSIDGALSYVMYGYEGSVDDLIKLDFATESQVCNIMRRFPGEALPEVLNTWLHLEGGKQ